MSFRRNQRPGTVPTTSKAATSAPSPTPGNPRPSANAWTRPLQQSSNGRSRTAANSSDLNGITHGSRISSSNYTGAGNRPSVFDEPPLNSKEAVQNVLRERFLHLTLSMIGQRVTLTMTNGSIIEGIFHTFTPFDNHPHTKKNVYVIKACKSIQGPNIDEESKKEDSSDIEVTNGCTALIPAEKVSNLHIKSMRLETVSLANTQKAASTRPTNNGYHNSIDLRTDTEISRGGLSKSEELVAAGSAWTSSNDQNSKPHVASTSLESSAAPTGRKGLFGTALSSSNGHASASDNLTGSIGEWDQFSANEKLTQKKATFDENIYTTQLDKSKIDTRKIEEAERLAREIEGTVSSNIHIAEERGHKLQGDFDEEDLYSGVLSSGNRVRLALAASKKKDTKSNVESEPTKVESKTGDPTAPATSTEPKASAESSDVKPVTSAKKVMNYAAAAAKADTTEASGSTNKSTSPTTIKSETTGTNDAETDNTSKEPSKASSDEPKEDKNASNNKAISTEEGESKEKVESAATDKVKEEKTEDATSKESDKASEGKEPKDKSSESEKPKVTSKLNANAKAFTFNPSAKSFTPSSVSTSTAPAPAPSHSNVIDQQMGMHVSNAPVMPGMSHYMHTQMAPGMMPMMNSHYTSNMRYQHQPPYTMMSQHGAQMPQQSQQIQSAPGPIPQQQNSQAPQPDGQGAPVEGDDQSANTQSASGDSNHSDGGKQTQGSEVQMSQHTQQQGISVTYGVAQASGYYANGMPIQQHARGGAPNMAYPPMVGNHQQIPVVHGRNPYAMYGAIPAHMQQPGGMPNMAYSQVRGPSGPYYPSPVAPGHYPASSYGNANPVHMDDGEQGYRSGRGGRGGGRNNNRRNSSRKGGRGNGGRGHYHGGAAHYQGGSESQSKGGSPPPDSGSGNPSKAGDETNHKTEAQSQEPKSTSDNTSGS